MKYRWTIMAMTVLYLAACTTAPPLIDQQAVSITSITGDRPRFYATVSNMPRRPRLKLAAVPLHIIQRGNNRGACFFAEDDYQFYLDHLGQACKKHGVDLHAYVLMTNHAHLLLTPEDCDGPSQVMKQLGQRYVQYVNRSYRRSGTLWEGRFRSCLKKKWSVPYYSQIISHWVIQ